MSNHSHRYHHFFIAVMYGLLILLAATTAVYSWQHHKLTKARAEETSLTSQLQTVKNQLDALKNQPRTSVIANIAPLDIQLNLPPYMQISYAKRPSTNAYDLSSAELGAMAADCIVTSGNDRALDSALGSLSLSTKAPTNNKDVLHTAAGYVSYTPPTTNCSDVPNVSALLKLERQAVVNAVDQHLGHPDQPAGASQG